MVRLDLLTLVVRNAQFFFGGGKMEKRTGKFVNYVNQQQQNMIIEWLIDRLVDGWIDWLMDGLIDDGWMMISDPSLFLLPVEVSIMIIINKKNLPKSVNGWLI